MAKNIWNSAHEWLNDKIAEHQLKKDAKELAGMLFCLLDKLDSEDIQDVFGSEMTQQGFYLDLDKCELSEADPVEQEWSTAICFYFLQMRLRVEIIATLPISELRKFTQAEIDNQIEAEE